MERSSASIGLCVADGIAPGTAVSGVDIAGVTELDVGELGGGGIDEAAPGSVPPVVSTPEVTGSSPACASVADSINAAIHAEEIRSPVIAGVQIKDAHAEPRREMRPLFGDDGRSRKRIAAVIPDCTPIRALGK